MTNAEQTPDQAENRAARVVVTGEVVSDNVNPTLIPRKDEPKKKKSA